MLICGEKEGYICKNNNNPSVPPLNMSLIVAMTNSCLGYNLLPEISKQVQAANGLVKEYSLHSQNNYFDTQVDHTRL
jgi:carbamate kinase